MCDTLVRIGKTTFFGKNSDRDPGEPQMIHYCHGFDGITVPSHPEKLKKYDTNQFRTLIEASRGYESPLRALISQPAWMWGAEMGVNELGVAIGNEAVFSRSSIDRNGLLGMDILRMALHNGKTAQEAAEVIVSLIEQFSQGGDASYKGHLSYHNSFLIQDSIGALVLETAGKKWAMKTVGTHASISNAYSLGTEYDAADTQTAQERPDFSRRHSSGIHLFFTKGKHRQHTTETALSAIKSSSWQEMRNILISHEGTETIKDRTMRSICIDAKGLVSSQTTASMIVESSGKSTLVWMTGSPLPYYHPYIPFTISSNAFENHDMREIRNAYAFAQNRILLTQRITTASKETRRTVSQLARELEASYEALVREPFEKGDSQGLDDACTACQKLLHTHDERIDRLVS
jgi:secernin